MKISPNRVSIALTGYFMTTISHADSQLSLMDEEEFFRDLPVVISATRLLQPLKDVPEAMTIIDRRIIEASGAQTIPDVLRLVPGFQVGQVTGSRVTATYHGYSDRFARNIEVLVDGRSVYDAAHGLVSWPDLPLALENIERIEVMRGPNAAAHGANAFSATINIITLYPFEQQGVLGKITHGNPDSNTLLLNYAGTDENFEYRITTRYDDDEGIETRFDDSRTRMFNFTGINQLNTNDRMVFAFGASEGDRDDGFGKTPADDPFDVYQPERKTEHHNSFQQLKWVRSLSVDNEYTVQFYHNYQKIDDTFESILFSQFDPDLPTAIQALFGQPDQRLTLGYGFESDRYDLEFQHRQQLNEIFQLAWGAGFRIDSASDPVTFGSNKTFTRNQARLFINTEWYALTQLVINAGVMIEKVEGISTQWLPRLAANYHVDNHHTLRFSVSKSIRIPTLLEEHYNFSSRFEDGAIFDYVLQSTGNIKPEELQSVEFGYIANIPQLDISWDLKFFRDKLENRIRDPKNLTCLEAAIADSSVCDFFDSIGEADYRGAYTSQNSGNANIKGVEIGMDWDISNSSWLRVAYAYADSYTNEINQVNPLAYTTTESHAPDVTYSLLLANNFSNNVQFSTAYYYLDDIDWVGEGNEIQAYHRLDMQLSKSFKGDDISGKLSLVLQNINNQYTDFQDENIMDQRTYLSAELFFK